MKLTPGFKAFIIAPQPDKATGLTAAKGYYNCSYGKIAVEWRCENNNFILNVTVPANTSARIIIPAADTVSIKELGGLLKNIKSATLSSFYKGIATILIKSGSYHFETKYSL